MNKQASPWLRKLVNLSKVNLPAFEDILKRAPDQRALRFARRSGTGITPNHFNAFEGIGEQGVGLGQTPKFNQLLEARIQRAQNFPQNNFFKERIGKLQSYQARQQQSLSQGQSQFKNNGISYFDDVKHKPIYSEIPTNRHIDDPEFVKPDQFAWHGNSSEFPIAPENSKGLFTSGLPQVASVYGDQTKFIHQIPASNIQGGLPKIDSAGKQVPTSWESGNFYSPHLETVGNQARIATLKRRSEEGSRYRQDPNALQQSVTNYQNPSHFIPYGNGQHTNLSSSVKNPYGIISKNPLYEMPIPKLNSPSLPTHKVEPDGMLSNLIFAPGQQGKFKQHAYYNQSLTPSTA